MSRTMFALKSTQRLCRSGESWHRRPLRRLIALIGPVFAIALLLVLSPPAQVHGDYDDDDGDSRPCPTAPPCGCAQAAPAPSAPAPVVWPNYGCAEEYLGFAVVHWHDFWRTCRPTPPTPPKCYGDILEGEPWYQMETYFCPEFGDCPRDKCCPPQREQSSSLLQPRYAKSTDVFLEKGQNDDYPNMTSVSDDYAELTDMSTGKKHTFKLYAIVTMYPGERHKTRLIGEELDPKESASVAPKRRAYWSKNEPDIGKPSTGSKEHHWIDVELKTATPASGDPFPKGSTERFHVTTFGEVTHQDQ